MNAPADFNIPQSWLRRYRWPLIIVALLAGHTTLMLVAVALATRDPGFAVDPGYYQKSLHWDQTQARRRASDKLGWQIAIDPAPTVDASGVRHVTFALTDKDGNAVDAGSLELTYFHHAHGRDSKSVSLSRAGETFTAELVMPWRGVWEFQVKAEANGQTFVKSQVVEVLR